MCLATVGCGFGSYRQAADLSLSEVYDRGVITRSPLLLHNEEEIRTEAIVLNSHDAVIISLEMGSHTETEIICTGENSSQDVLKD